MIIYKADLPSLLEATARDAQVLVPLDFQGGVRFAPWSAGCNPRFDAHNSKISPKAALLPATEPLYSWEASENSLAFNQARLDDTPRVLFGVRPCDAAAIARLDSVFLEDGYVDEFYEARRHALCVVSIACTQAESTCFCESMGLNPNEAPNADVLLREGQDAYDVIAQTERGQKLVESWGSFTHDGQANAVEAHCGLSVDMTGVAEKLPSLFESDLWEEVADSCLTCGTCTFTCPTCYCFDISQDKRASRGSRFRCWDSCMFPTYTLMAGGHNPRARKSQRIRQRFMHKLCFFEQRYGSSLCVGCGRCIESCPAAIDITELIKKIGEREV